MKNKLHLQMISGIFLVVSYFTPWAYNGGFTKFSANEMANWELWGNITPFLMSFIPLIPFIGIASVWLSWKKKYSSIYNVAVCIFLTPVLIRTWFKINHFAIEFGFYIAILALGVTIYSLSLFRKDLSGHLYKEWQVVLVKLKAIRKRFGQKSS